MRSAIHLLYLPIFPEGTLVNTLFRAQKQHQEGANTFKVQASGVN